MRFAWARIGGSPIPAAPFLCGPHQQSAGPKALQSVALVWVGSGRDTSFTPGVLAGNGRKRFVYAPTSVW
jgi:hypothetical protein